MAIHLTIYCERRGVQRRAWRALQPSKHAQLALHGSKKTRFKILGVKSSSATRNWSACKPGALIRLRYVTYSARKIANFVIFVILRVAWYGHFAHVDTHVAPTSAWPDVSWHSQIDL